MLTLLYFGLVGWLSNSQKTLKFFPNLRVVDLATESSRQTPETNIYIDP